jgi:hypothetical protein
VRSTPKEGVIELLVEVLRGQPRLPRALCRGEWPTFDGEDEADKARALEICSHCPELAACRDWRDRQPWPGVTGVVGGDLLEYVSHPAARPS